MRILITGGKGNIATIIKNGLSEYYEIINPSHSELDVLDMCSIQSFLNNHENFDILIHSAIIGGRRTKTEEYDIFYKNIRMMENVLKFENKFKMIINFDSGAIYDRNTDIMNRKENELFTIPTDFYGFSKYVIYSRSLQYRHIFNFRIFNIFHELEESDRFIKMCCIAKQNNSNVTIHADKYFDFVYKDDFVKIVKYYIDNCDKQDVLEKTLNICYERKYLLSDVAKLILPPTQIVIENIDLSHNYCGDNSKLQKMNIHVDGLENSMIKYETNFISNV
uniref:NAD-dependent epimerase/dehydratase domain-containing protein n=1 Tax=viral metagenome TaxID=1070528 RepID=A0A6C0HC08_9ZZZZ